MHNKIKFTSSKTVCYGQRNDCAPGAGPLPLGVHFRNGAPSDRRVGAAQGRRGVCTQQIPVGTEISARTTQPSVPVSSCIGGSRDLYFKQPCRCAPIEMSPTPPCAVGRAFAGQLLCAGAVAAFLWGGAGWLEELAD